MESKNIKLKKCKICGTEFRQYNSLQNKCNDCQIKYLYSNSKPKLKPLLKQKKSISKIKKDKSELQKLRDKVWELWSSYIRKKEKYICFTCGRQKDKKTTNLGHFKHGKLDFDPMNVHCQCDYCNIHLHGNLGVYASKLIEKYGLKKFNNLVLRANQHTNKYTISELEEIIEKIREKTLYSKNLPF